MAPALIRPRGVERIATARALEAAARLPRTPDEGARSATAAAVNAAWHTLFLVRGGPGTDAGASRSGLERLLVRAGSALTRCGPGSGVEEETRLLSGWAADSARARRCPPCR